MTVRGPPQAGLRAHANAGEPNRRSNWSFYILFSCLLTLLSPLFSSVWCNVPSQLLLLEGGGANFPAISDLRNQFEEEEGCFVATEPAF